MRVEIRKDGTMMEVMLSQSGGIHVMETERALQLADWIYDLANKDNEKREVNGFDILRWQ